MKISSTIIALLLLFISSMGIAQTNCPQYLKNYQAASQRAGNTWQVPNECQLPQLLDGGQRFANNANRCSFYDCAGNAATSQMSCQGDSNYFLAYGKVYCNRFVNRTAANLSGQGVRWMNQVLLCLQGALKRTCVYGGACRDCASTKAYAFKSHVACYTGRDNEKQGRIPGRLSICDLSVADQYQVFQTPDKKDLIKREALDQAASTGSICAAQYANSAVDAAKKTGRRLLGID